jgi:Ca2+-binding RTX toxin-like protein
LKAKGKEAAGRRRGDRPTALVVALCVVLAFTLGAGAVVAAKAIKGKTIKGTPSGDVLKGTKRGERIYGRGGDDLIKGKKGRDRLFGNAGNDTIDGGKGKDKVRGGPGADVLAGGEGNDRIVGGDGRNELNMADGVQQGSPGDDLIDARNGQLDEIDCGAGDDVVYVDRAEDGVYDCEKVVTP